MYLRCFVTYRTVSCIPPPALATSPSLPLRLLGDLLPTACGASGSLPPPFTVSTGLARCLSHHLCLFFHTCFRSLSCPQARSPHHCPLGPLFVLISLPASCRLTLVRPHLATRLPGASTAALALIFLPPSVRRYSPSLIGAVLLSLGPAHMQSPMLPVVLAPLLPLFLPCHSPFADAAVPVSAGLCLCHPVSSIRPPRFLSAPASRLHTCLHCCSAIPPSTSLSRQFSARSPRSRAIYAGFFGS